MFHNTEHLGGNENEALQVGLELGSRRAGGVVLDRSHAVVGKATKSFSTGDEPIHTLIHVYSTAVDHAGYVPGDCGRIVIALEPETILGNAHPPPVVGVLVTAGHTDAAGAETWNLPGRLRVFEIRERIATDGCVLDPLNEQDVRTIVGKLCAEQVDAIAISFLNSRLNPAHEALAALIAGTVSPDTPVVTSAGLLEAQGFRQRTFRAIREAAFAATLGPFLERLRSQLLQMSPSADLALATGEGSAVSAEAAQEHLSLLVRGRAAASVAGAAGAACHAGFAYAIAVDVEATHSRIAGYKSVRNAATASSLNTHRAIRNAVDLELGTETTIHISPVTGLPLLVTGFGPEHNRGAQPEQDRETESAFSIQEAETVLGLSGAEVGQSRSESGVPDETANAASLAESLDSTPGQLASAAIRMAAEYLVGDAQAILHELGGDVVNTTLVTTGTDTVAMHAMVTEQLGIPLFIPPDSRNIACLGALSLPHQDTVVEPLNIVVEPEQADKLVPCVADDCRLRVDLESYSFWLDPSTHHSERYSREEVCSRIVKALSSLSRPPAESGLDTEVATALWNPFQCPFPVTMPGGQVDLTPAAPSVQITAISRSRRTGPVLSENIWAGTEDSEDAVSVLAAHGSDTSEPSAVDREVWWWNTGAIEPRPYSLNELTAGQQVDGPAITSDAVEPLVFVPPGWHMRAGASGDLTIRPGESYDRFGHL